MNRRDFGKLAGLAAASSSSAGLFARATTSRKGTDTNPDLAARMASYDVVWATPSTSSRDSMPLCGAEGTALNVWVQDGSIYFYIGLNEAYDEDGNLDKLGCVRLSLEPNPLIDAQFFEQKLDPFRSRVTIRARSKTNEQCDFTLWLDEHKRTVLIDGTSSTPSRLSVSFMTWRDTRRDYPLDNRNFATRAMADKARRATNDHVRVVPSGLLFYHQNDNNQLIADQMVVEQKLPVTMSRTTDPSRDLVFGGLIRGANLIFDEPMSIAFQQWQGSSWNGKTTSASKEHSLSVALLARQDLSIEQWTKTITSTAEQFDSPRARQISKKQSGQAWMEFWSRSYIFINPGKGPEDIGWQVGKNYQLFRYMLGCNRRGSLPLKFNGGILNVDAHNPQPFKVDDGGHGAPAAPPDYRRWGNFFMAQNQRLLGWPCLSAGDFDLMNPSLDFYKDRVSIAEARSETYWHHGGAAFVEPLSLYGMPVQYLSSDSGYVTLKHLSHHFSIQIEFAWMALQKCRYSGEDAGRYLPLIWSVVRFYDEHYRQEQKSRAGRELNEDGKLVLYPMNCLELYENATNPIEVVCGLQRVVSGVLGLPHQNVPDDMRQYFAELHHRLPVMHFEEREGKQVLSPAERYDASAPYNKTEFPEGFAVWPYQMAGIGTAIGSDAFNNTWDTMPKDRQLALGYMSWQCTPIYAALSGRKADAQRLIEEKLADKNASYRFPAFFGPGHDWLPDHNWGGSGMIGLQSMLVAATDEGVHLLPAWPEEWSVEFKLHLPDQNTVTAHASNGKLTRHQIASRQPNVGRPEVIIVGPAEE